MTPRLGSGSGLASGSEESPLWQAQSGQQPGSPKTIGVRNYVGIRNGDLCSLTSSSKGRYLTSCLGMIRTRSVLVLDTLVCGFKMSWSCDDYSVSHWRFIWGVKTVTESAMYTIRTKYQHSSLISKNALSPS